MFEAFALFAYHHIAERFPLVAVAQSQRERYLRIEAVRDSAQVGPAGRVTFVGGEEVQQEESFDAQFGLLPGLGTKTLFEVWQNPASFDDV